MAPEGIIRTIDALKDELCQQAELFDDPQVYTAGVLDTLDALTGTLPEVAS